MNDKMILAETAHTIKERVVALKTDIGINLLELGHLFKRMRDEHLYAALGHDTFNDFLGDPEVSMSRTAVYGFIEIWEVFIERLKREQTEIAGIDYSKLLKICPVVDRDPDEWISKASELSRSDLIKEVKAELGEPDVALKPDAPDPFTCGLDVPTGRATQFKEFVKSCPCIICGKTPSDPHHFPVTKGAGGNAVDGWVIPLCREHHSEAQEGGKDWVWTYRKQWGAFYYSVIFSLMQRTLKDTDKWVSVEPIGEPLQDEVIEAEVVVDPPSLPALPAHEEPAVAFPKPEKKKKGRAKVFKPQVLTPEDAPDAPLPFSKFGTRVDPPTTAGEGGRK